MIVTAPDTSLAVGGSERRARAGTPSHCPYCALQCGQWIDGSGGVDAREFPTNRGGLCQKAGRRANSSPTPNG